MGYRQLSLTKTLHQRDISITTQWRSCGYPHFTTDKLQLRVLSWLCSSRVSAQ